jgi:predicted HicB family RNase H-like nuclease
VIRGYGVRLDWSEADEAYVATSPEFPGLTGVNEDADAALAELREALEMAIAVLEEDGEPLPERQPLIEHSGQFRLRTPKALHATLARQAEEAGVSLNSYVVTCLAFSAGYAEAQGEFGAELQLLLRDIRAEVARSVQRGRSAATATRGRADEYQPADAFAAAGTAFPADLHY